MAAAGPGASLDEVPVNPFASSASSTMPCAKPKQITRAASMPRLKRRLKVKKAEPAGGAKGELSLVNEEEDDLPEWLRAAEVDLGISPVRSASACSGRLDAKASPSSQVNSPVESPEQFDALLAEVATPPEEPPPRRRVPEETKTAAWWPTSWLPQFPFTESAARPQTPPPPEREAEMHATPTLSTRAPEASGISFASPADAKNADGELSLLLSGGKPPKATAVDSGKASSPASEVNAGARGGIRASTRLLCG